MTNFKPMLADDADLSRLVYPVMVSPKLDGVRATFVGGRLLTRSLKPLPNKAIDQHFKLNSSLDGELIVGDPNSPSVFRDTMKVVMSHEADIADLKLYVFDWVGKVEFFQRLMDAHALCKTSGERYVPVPHVFVENEKELLDLEEKTLNNGYEGLMLRDPNGPYKFGRATMREGTLLKLKRKKTSEAEILGFVEQMHNANEAKIDNLGYLERSSHQANLVPMGVLGALMVRDVHTHVEFNIGTGFSAEDRAVIWRLRDSYLGKLVSYEYLPVGVKDKPRHPVFAGFRSRRDL